MLIFLTMKIIQHTIVCGLYIKSKNTEQIMFNLGIANSVRSIYVNVYTIIPFNVFCPYYDFKSKKCYQFQLNV